MTYAKEGDVVTVGMTVLEYKLLMAMLGCAVRWLAAQGFNDMAVNTVHFFYELNRLNPELDLTNRDECKQLLFPGSVSPDPSPPCARPN
jgi:hypothetical protein